MCLPVNTLEGLSPFYWLTFLETLFSLSTIFSTMYNYTLYYQSHWMQEKAFHSKDKAWARSRIWLGDESSFVLLRKWFWLKTLSVFQVHVFIPFLFSFVLVLYSFCIKESHHVVVCLPYEGDSARVFIDYHLVSSSNYNCYKD